MSVATSCSTRAVGPRLATAVWLLAAAVGIAAACNRHDPAAQQQPPAAKGAQPASSRPPHVPAAQGRDLSIDESMGGHTLARHVGKTDADLAERLRREPQISAASTYTDRAAAGRAVGSAVESSSLQLASWSKRQGRRPNLVLHYVSRDGPLGRSLARGARAAVSCGRAIVVLRWDERRERFYVLTSYPEADR
ncbi:MAG: RNase A-like domain-containing protein [Vicinamibacterales bacterium]